MIRAHGQAVPSQATNPAFTVERKTKALHPLFKSEQSVMTRLLKASPDGRSSQGFSLGRKEHPFDFEMVARFQTANPHHGRCIHAKVGATVGLGFETEADKARKKAKREGMPEPSTTAEQEIAKIDMVLDPLTRHSWQDLCNDLVEDFWQTGNAYIEVVRSEARDGAEITGLHHIPAREVYVVLENLRYDFHYEIQSGDDSGGNRLFARWGDLDGFLERLGTDQVSFSLPGSFARLEEDNEGNPLVSEVIHIRRPTSLSRWYGFPDWLAAVAQIELAQCLTQHNYDFFLNRGVPEFMLFLLGGRLDDATQQKISSTLQKATGLGNSHKSAVVGLPNGMAAQMERLAVEHSSDTGQFATMSDNIALQIVSAHGVPPLLAGIQIPGKLGAANELVQAMTSFQALSISPAQRLISRTLDNTLGGEGANLGLVTADFVLNTILDQINLPALDTVSRQRQDPVEASAEGRDPSEGVKD